MPRFSGETHGPKLSELPILSFCWMLHTFQSNQVGLDAKHSDESISRILSGHCQPSIRRVLFPNTVCKSKEVTGSSYIPDMPMAQNHVPPKKQILYVDNIDVYQHIISPLQIEVYCVPSAPPHETPRPFAGPHSYPILNQSCGQVACQPLWRCEGTISAWGRDSCASAAEGWPPVTTLVNFLILPWDLTGFLGQFSPVSKHQTFMG